MWSNRSKRTNREGTKSGMGRLKRMKHDRGIKDRDVKSSGIEILIDNSFTKINPTEPLRFAEPESRRKRNWSDSSGGNSLTRADDSRWVWKNSRRLKVNINVVWSVDWYGHKRDWVWSSERLAWVICPIGCKIDRPKRVLVMVKSNIRVQGGDRLLICSWGFWKTT
jgi:hypothetical protein